MCDPLLKKKEEGGGKEVSSQTIYAKALKEEYGKAYYHKDQVAICFPS